jgi:hypothetical protein
MEAKLIPLTNMRDRLLKLIPLTDMQSLYNK